MVEVTMFSDRSGDLVGFTTRGHAGYADAGQDIVCAAVSALTINCMNSIEQFCSDYFVQNMNPETGEVDFQIEAEKVSASAEFLLQSLALGLQSIEAGYGTEFIHITLMKQEV